jgi:hypothetical protein
MRQQLLTLGEHLRSPSIFGQLVLLIFLIFCVLVLCVVCIRSLFGVPNVASVSRFSIPAVFSNVFIIGILVFIMHLFYLSMHIALTGKKSYMR